MGISLLFCTCIMLATTTAASSPTTTTPNASTEDSNHQRNISTSSTARHMASIAMATTKEYSTEATEPSTLETSYAFSNLSQLLNGTSEGRAGKRVFIRSGNELWDGLVDDCLYKPSFSCFQKNVFHYLDGALKLDDVNVTDRLVFRKIDVNASRIADELAAENEIPDDEEDQARSGE